MINDFFDNIDNIECILDCNRAEKLIIELNNHICLGEYELARTFFKQIIKICPEYVEIFYRTIFSSGIPENGFYQIGLEHLQIIYGCYIFIIRMN